MTDRTRELHDAFDAGFATAFEPDRTDLVDLLLIRAGGVAYAISRADITSVHADVRVIAMPTRAAELLGVAALRSAVVPVYALERVLAAGSPTPATATRWLVTIDHLAFAFDGFDGYRKLPRPAIGAARGYLRGTIELEGVTRAILDIPSLVAAMPRRAHKDK